MYFEHKLATINQLFFLSQKFSLSSLKHLDSYQSILRT